MNMTLCVARAAPALARAPELVGVGAWGVATNGQLMTLALGSCVAVCLFDAGATVGGLLHFLLPEARVDPVQARARPGMFADAAMPLFCDDIIRAGGRRTQLRAKLIGGASLHNAPAALEIGKRNVLAARRWLWQAGILVVVEDTGGAISRSIVCHTASGLVRLTSPGLTAREL